MAAWAAVGLVVVVVAGTLTAYAKYRDVWNSIKRVHVVDLGKRPPQYSPTSLNILVIGSDSRSGKNARFGAAVQGQRSDTVMIFHLSPGRKRATVLSIPRDSVVPVLACQREPGFAGQQAQPGEVEQINASFAYGGPGCLWKTVEQTTHIHIDHFVELNFTGFEKVVNDIGGVNVCLPWAISDPKSDLNLSKGRHHIWGPEALAFWRVRYIGDGSDLQRIRRDQYLMASVVHGITRSNLLSSPTKIYSVITDGARAMTTDSGLSLGTMISMAESLRGLSAGSVQFIEVPNEAYPPDPNWVQWPEPQADRLFSAIAHDRTVPKAAAPRAPAKATPPTLASVAASGVHIEVLNGSGAAGVAGQAGAALARQGFNIAGTGDAGSFGFTRSVIEYSGSAGRSAARVLRAQLLPAVIKSDPALPAGTLELIIGSRYTGLAAARQDPAASVQASVPASAAPSASASPSPAASSSASPSASSSVGSLSKAFSGITGNTNVCADTGAFAGPDGHS